MARQDVKKEINYLNKDFQSFRNNLMEFAKSYFPNSYNDFNETSPGMMFIEMASYVGDVLSYYVDTSLKESLLPYAEERSSVLTLAQTLGYKPFTSTPAITSIDVYQVVPNDSIAHEILDDGIAHVVVRDNGVSHEVFDDGRIHCVVHKAIFDNGISDKVHGCLLKVNLLL